MGKGEGREKWKWERKDEGGVQRGAGGESRRNQVGQRKPERTQGPPNTRKQPDRTSVV